jgi:hypothetical protein
MLESACMGGLNGCGSGRLVSGVSGFLLISSVVIYFGGLLCSIVVFSFFLSVGRGVQEGFALLSIALLCGFFVWFDFYGRSKG